MGRLTPQPQLHRTRNNLTRDNRVSSAMDEVKVSCARCPH